MGSKDKYYASRAASHGFDDVGLAQPTGTISAIANSTTVSVVYKEKLLLTVNSTTGLKKGQAIRISALDSGHNGLTRILSIVSSTKMIVNIPYNNTLSDGTGVWSVDGGAGAWDSFMPIGADLTAANIAMTFWKPSEQGSNEVAVNYTKDQLYMFPAGIKTIQISTAGNVRLFRSASLRPNGLPAQ